MKITMIGGASTYVPLMIQNLIQRISHPAIHFALYDINSTNADQIAESSMWSSVAPAGVDIRSYGDIEQAIEGADLVILLYRAGPPGIRSILERIAIDHNLLAQETQGICGFLSALPNVVQLQNIAPLIHSNCPGARVIVLTNPTGIITAAAQELSLNAIGLCELPFGMVESLDRSLRKFELNLDLSDLTYVGLNHFGWIVWATAVDSDTNLLSGMADDEYGFETYVPPSIPVAVAKAAHTIECAGLPNPYLGFLVHTPKDYARAALVRRTEMSSRAAILNGDWSEYHKLLERRGGFLIGPALADLVHGLLLSTPTNAVLCSRNADLAARFGVNAAYEFSVKIDATGGISPVLRQPNLSPAMEEMISLVAKYETETITAAMSGSIVSSQNALILNPYIAPGSAALQAVRSFLDAYAPQLLEPSRCLD